MWPHFSLPRPRFRFSFHLPHSVRTPFLLSYLFAATTSFLAFGYYTQLPPVIPLLYTIAEPAAQLVTKEWVFLFPVLALTMSGFHTFLVQSLHEHGRVMARLFALSTVVVQLLLMVGLIRIILIVT
jgi:hypothetical protein